MHRRRTSPDGHSMGWTARYGRGWERAFGQHHDERVYANYYDKGALGTGINLSGEVRHGSSSDPVGVWESWGTLEDSETNDRS